MMYLLAAGARATYLGQRSDPEISPASRVVLFQGEARYRKADLALQRNWETVFGPEK